MSGRLRDVVGQYLVKAGRRARISLCETADVSRSALDNIIGNRTKPYVPSAAVAYRLAKACGCSEEDALSIANECSSAIRKSA